MVIQGDCFLIIFTITEKFKTKSWGNSHQEKKVVFSYSEGLICVESNFHAS